MSIFRIVTVAREYGSGGGTIARLLAERLGWRLLDQALIREIAEAAQVDPSLCAQLDENLDPWLHRLAKFAFGHGTFDAPTPPELFDSDSMAAFVRRVITEAARIGDCVIVGRGAQCILQGRVDAFHVYIYAPMHERVRRITEKFGAEKATPEAMRANDRARAAYVKHHYECEWCNPHLYHAMFSSTIGEEAVAAGILAALRGKT